MAKYTTCLVKKPIPGSTKTEVFCQKRSIYTSTDPVYVVIETILNHFAKQGWSLYQMESNIAETILVFERKA